MEKQTRTDRKTVKQNKPKQKKTKERKEGRKKKKTKYKCLNKEGMSNNMGWRILGRSEGRSWGRIKTSPSA